METGRNELDFWYGMDEKKSPPVSIEDRTVDARGPTGLTCVVLVWSTLQG